MWTAMAGALAAGVGPAVAQTSEIESAKSQRDAVREEAAAAASELDPLLTEDAELEAAVAALDAHVDAQEARLEATRQAIEAAELDSDRIAERTSEVQDDILALRARLRDQAVDAYLRPAGESLAEMLASNDLNEATKKQALLGTVTDREVDLLDELRAAGAEMLALERAAQDAVDRVEQRRAEEERQLVALEASRAEQQRLREALADRISEVQAEIDALAAEEAQITSTIQALIAEEDARRAAEAEARRRAEEAARLASLSEGRVGAGSGGTASGTGTGAGATTGGTGSSSGSGSTPLPTPATAVGGLTWPLGGAVTSSFGPRWGRMHQGIDINAAIGTPVGSAGPGTVISAGSNGGYGLVVIVDHGGGLSTVYAHLSEIWVSAGQSVGTGSGLGASGCTGSCTGPHLHFEVRVLGIAQDPMLYL
ncbi:MAG: peptidoglycan DD-metalloendopeptidase family protein [Acidimicrobiales bacterium]|nr:peptidoglycan DD-metalloendopeptidase family protein [Acidimicrobiales bacterium]